MRLQNVGLLKLHRFVDCCFVWWEVGYDAFSTEYAIGLVKVL